MEKDLIHLPIPDYIEVTAKVVLDSAFQVHTTLGPGLLESVYEACMEQELKIRGINVKSQVALPIFYKGIRVDSGFRLDLLVEDYIIVELKSTEELSALHKAQVLTYLRLANIRLGFLINFNVVHLRDGIKRIIN